MRPTRGLTNKFSLGFQLGVLKMEVFIESISL